jgi:hypothetical protein
VLVRRQSVGEPSIAKLGYAEAPTDPVRVLGVIVLRRQPLEVDDTLVYLMKRL